MENETQTTAQKNRKVNSVVANYVNLMKGDWAGLLAKHGYNEIEEDLTDDGQWHGDTKLLGRVGFWKQKGLDGIITEHGKGYDSYSGRTHHGTGVYMVGDSKKYFEAQGFFKYLKEQRQQGIKIGLLQKLKDIIHPKIEFIGHSVEIKLNEGNFKAFNIYDNLEFYDFLNSNKKD